MGRAGRDDNKATHNQLKCHFLLLLGGTSKNSDICQYKAAYCIAHKAAAQQYEFLYKQEKAKVAALEKQLALAQGKDKMQCN